MKPIGFAFFTLITAVCTALLVNCASTQTSTQNRESMLVASGFKVIRPKTPAQQQKLQNLPPGKVTMIQKGKKTYYIFPDPVQNKAYVGGPKEYQAYHSSVLQINLRRRILKPPRCTRMRRCSGVYGAAGEGALDHGDQWEGRSSAQLKNETMLFSHVG
jgi:hypothetical protein